MADLEELKDYNYPSISPIDYIDESLENLLARDNAAKSSFRRLASFPSVTSEDIGMKIYLVGQGNFQLISVDPEPQWKQLTDDSRNAAYTDWVSQNYQPLSKLLTSLSRLKEAVNAIPYFNKQEDLQAIALSGYMKNLLTLADSKDVIKALKLGSAAGLDYPIHGDYIEDGTIPMSALSDSLIQNLGFSTGDTKLTLKTLPDSGWVMADDGTIGSATSGATNRANADTYDLFRLLWSNPYCTLQTFSGGNTEKTTFADDWRSNKRLVLPRILGRTIGVAGQGQSLTKRDLGSYTGAETTMLTAAHIPSHTHGVRTSNAGSKDGYDTSTGYLARGFTKYSSPWDSSYVNVNKNLIEPSPQAADSARKISLIQPTSFLNLMIKL